MSTTLDLPMDVNAIKRILPHRYPFLLIDRIIDVDLEASTIIGQKNVTANEEFFKGHFPGAPIMPGVLILESVAQTGGVLAALKMQTDQTAVLMNVKECKFRRVVKPGDVLRIECQGLHFSSKGGRIQAKAYVDERVVMQCEVTFCFVDREAI